MNPVSEIISPQPATRSCAECGQQFELPPFKLAAEFIRVCYACTARQEADEQRRRDEQNAAVWKKVLSPEQRLEAWERICPKSFLDTQPDQLPNPTKYERVMRWQYGRKGLLLHGETRRGKSRCAWALMRREFLAGRAISVLTASFALEYAARFATSTADAYRLVQAKMDAELLLVDDVFKVKITDSVEQALFVIIDHCLNQCIPIIATTNDTGETLAGRMTDDRGPAIIARLKEACEPIPFL